MTPKCEWGALVLGRVRFRQIKKPTHVSASLRHRVETIVKQQFESGELVSIEELMERRMEKNCRIEPVSVSCKIKTASNFHSEMFIYWGLLEDDCEKLLYLDSYSGEPVEKLLSDKRPSDLAYFV